MATADMTVHTDAQHDLSPSDTINFFPARMQELSVPIVVGTYATIERPLSKDSEVPLYSWDCCVYLAGSPWSDISPFIESVVFHLHKSFKNVRRILVLNKCVIFRTCKE